MVESLVITLREGIEAALVIGIILAYLRKTGRESLKQPVYLGLALAVMASVGVAWFFRAVDFDPDNEYLAGTLFAVAGLFVASMVVWMWRTARGLKGEMESRLSAITLSTKEGTAPVLGLVLFTFFMVFREGIETMMFLAAVGLGEKADPLGLVGALLGLALASLFAVLFVRGSIRINLGRFFKVTGVVLLVLAAKLLGGAAHEFGEIKLIPINKEIMAILGFLVRDDTATMLVMALVAVPIFLLLWESLRQPKPASVPGEGPAERRKRLASARLERTWQVVLGAATLAIVLALGSTALAGSDMLDPEPRIVIASANAVELPVDALEAGVMNKYAYTTSSGTVVRFLLVKLKDGTIISALDACEICGAVGYGQRGDTAICKNCNAPIAFATFSRGGGCNPRVLTSKTVGANIQVNASDLESAAVYFQ